MRQFLLGLIAVGFATQLHAQELNPTGRTLDLATPVFQDGRLIGDVSLRIGSDDSLSVDASGMISVLGDRVNPEVAAQIVEAADADGRVMLSAFEEAGAPLRYNPATLALVYTPSRGALGERSVSLARSVATPSEALEPANLAGFMNFSGGVRYEDSSVNDDTSFELDDIDIDGAVRFRGVVVEGDARYDQDDGEFYRRSTRAVYDLPERGDRFIAGDYRTPFFGIVDGSEILGIAVENNGTLRPSDNLSARGRTNFEIERASTVEVYINGTLVQRLRLDPGIFDLDDIPLTQGANNVSVIVEDDLGRREVAAFDQFFDAVLLAKGKRRYSAAAGIVSDTGSDQPDYETDRPAISAQIEYGLTDGVTVGSAARLTAEQGVIGASAVTVTPFGVFDLVAAGSYSDQSDIGAALELNWRYVFDEDNEDTSVVSARNKSLSARFAFTSEDFVDGDPFDLTLNEVEYDIDLSLGYSQPLKQDMFFGVNAFYGHSLDQSINSDRLSIGASLGGILGERSTWALRSEYVSDDDNDEGLNLGLLIGVRLGEHTTASASYESFDNRARATISHSKGRGVGSYGASLTVDRSDDDDEEIDVSGLASYTGNRFTAALSHREDLNSSEGGRSGRTALRAGTSIAFADGKFAIGRPISNAFVIASAHDSLEDKSVVLGRRGQEFEAKSGPLGPAVASGYSAYREAQVTTDVEELPVGYDLGAGLVQIRPPYKAGYAVEVGSDAQITLVGNLLDAFGDPIALATGTARNLDDPDFPPVQVFTNRSGRFALLGIKPGRYRITLSDDRTVLVSAPTGAVGLVRAGEFAPE